MGLNGVVRDQVSTHRAYGAGILPPGLEEGSVSTTVVECSTPAWGFDARIATVSLMRVVGPVSDSPTLAQSVARGVEVPSDGLVNYFEFREAWFRIEPAQGGSVGGTHLVTLHGQVQLRPPRSLAPPAISHSGLTRENMATSRWNSVTLSVGTPVCPYSVA